MFELFEQHEGAPFYASMCEHMCSGPVIALALEKNDAVAAWLEMIGLSSIRFLMELAQTYRAGLGAPCLRWQRIHTLAAS